MELLHGDCLELMKGIPDKSIDCILTDPPYGTTACKWDSVIPFEKMWEQLNRVIKPNGAIVLFGSEPFSSMLRCSNLKNYKYDWKWIKNRPTGAFSAKYSPMKANEDIMVFSKNKSVYYAQMVKRTPEEFKKSCRINDSVSWGNNIQNHKHNITRRKPINEQWYKYPINILHFKKDDKRDGTQHPTQKPVALLEYLIKTYTLECETVLDFTMGSGSTGVACVNTNRDFIGIELDDKYFEIASNRINDAIKQKQELLFS